MTPTETDIASQTPAVVEKLDDVVIRFAGDSGDGMQVTGTQFTNTSAQLGNDLSTLPDFPAEIRAPAGTLPGVSAFQVRIADYDIHTPGDAPDMLVAMNPAALKKELRDLKPNGVVIVNSDEFNERAFKKAGLASNPLEDGSLSGYRVHEVALGTMTKRALEGSGLDAKASTAARTSSPWAWPTGCSAGRSNRPRPGCGAASRPSPRSPRPTSR